MKTLRRLALVAALILAEVFFAYYLSLSKRKKEVFFASQRMQTQCSNYLAALLHYESSARLLVESVTKQPAALALLRDAFRASERDRGVLRDKLYQLTLPTYEQFLGAGLRQLHFHFRDGISFLRMHEPGAFGDQLFPVRPSVYLANTRNAPVQGFELGRFSSGFRYVFPLSCEGEHIGTVEASVSSRAVTQYMTTVFRGYHQFILAREVLDRRAGAEAQAGHQPSGLSDGYVVEQSRLGPPSRGKGSFDQPLVEEINRAVRPSVGSRLEATEPFFVTAKVSSRFYEVFFLPVRNAQGENEAWVASYYGDSPQPEFQADLLRSFAAGNGVLLLVLLFLLHMWRTAERLRVMKEAAESATRAKSQFLANMSHEIRTPLNGVIGMTRFLMDSELSQEQREYAETAFNSGELLLSIINDILDYSKIEAGKIEFEHIDFDLRSVLEETLDVFALKMHQKGLELVYGLDPNVPTLLRGDPGRLRQILMNYLGNAHKFTEKGEVVVRASLVAETGTHATLHFSVRDTGAGIPVDRMDRLFESFSQIDSSTTRKHGGTGLGLAISKVLADLMHGEVGVESELGKGATFWFTAVLEKQDAESRPEPPSVKDIRGKRILVVDDNATNRRMLTRQLETWECEFDEAPSAREALVRLREAAAAGTPFDLALLDMQMPEMDGEMLGQRIKADPALRDVVLIMLTSLDRHGDASRLREMGFVDYLTKPIKFARLLQCLAAALSGRAVLLPRHPVSVTGAPGSAPPPVRGDVRILLAEDNLINQKVALGMLRRMGFAADAVVNGRKAVDALSSDSYDLVLMDAEMPEMDGFEATRAIRDAGSPVKDHDIPVIAMTAHAMQGYRETCIQAGMDDYVSKPVNPKELQAAILRHLQRRDGEPAASAPSPQAGAAVAEAGDLEPAAAESLTRDVLDGPDARTVVPAGVVSGERVSAAEVQHSADVLAAAPFLSSFLAAMPHGVVILNSCRQIVAANQAFADTVGVEDPALLLGLRPGEALGCEHACSAPEGCGTSLFCETCGAVHAILQAQQGEREVQECRIEQRATGQVLQLHVVATSITVAQTPFVVFAVTSIAQEKFRRSRERRFYHDILNIAAGIQGLASLAEGASLGELREFQQTAYQLSEQLVEAIHAQRELSRAESNELTPRLVRIQSTELLSALANAFREQDYAGGKEIRLDPDLDDLELIGDRTMLENVLGHMLRNALEATGVGGVVTMGCRTDDGRAELWVHNPDVIPAEVQAQLFQKSFSNREGGRGVGTYVMKLLTERYLRGEVSFTSTAAAGTTFVARYPTG